MNTAEDNAFLARVRACTHCAHALDHPPRPVFQLDRAARILVASQAPGRRVHETGIPFNDRSGDRLLDWLGLSRAQFHDPNLVAILPMGLCWPGTGPSGDRPPRRECAPLWREPLLAMLKDLRLTLVIGRYAIDYHLPDGQPLDEQIRQSLDGNGPIALPHPSPANNRWLARNPWFERDVVPALRQRVAAAIKPDDANKSSAG